MERNSKKFIIIHIIFVIILLVTVMFINKENIINSVRNVKSLNIKEISYEVYSNEDDILKILVNVVDKENGISEIEIPDGNKLICQGQEEVGIDYEIKEDGEYTIISKSTTGETITKTIVVNEEFRKNLIQMVKIQEISTEQDYEVVKDVEGYNWYYTIGKDNEEWIQLPNYNVINVDAYKILEKELQDENGKVTVNLKRVGESGNTVKVSKLIDDFNVRSDIYNEEEQVIEGESIISCIKDNEVESGNYKLKVNGEEYSAEVYNYDEDVNYISDKNIGTLEENSRMLIMKYNGNLNTTEGRIITSQVRKKGMFICVKGDFSNNGEITMTNKGAEAKGQDVYLWKNEDDSYEFIPAVGANGGAGTAAYSTMVYNGKRKL